MSKLKICFQSYFVYGVINVDGVIIFYGIIIVNGVIIVDGVIIVYAVIIVYECEINNFVDICSQVTFTLRRTIASLVDLFSQCGIKKSAS